MCDPIKPAPPVTNILMKNKCLSFYIIVCRIVVPGLARDGNATHNYFSLSSLLYTNNIQRIKSIVPVQPVKREGELKPGIYVSPSPLAVAPARNGPTTS